MADTIVQRKKRISLLGVPVDAVQEDALEETLKELLADKGKHQIVFLTLFGLLRARGKSKFAKTIQEASLVIPVSKYIPGGAQFLKLTPPVRYMPFEFIIRSLGILEQYRHSVYLVGCKPDIIQVSSLNIRDSFPGLKVVGRYSGFFKKDQEDDVILAIRKASPSLLLIGSGMKGKISWFRNHRNKLNSGIAVWCEECFDIFSGKKERIDKKRWEKGTYLIAETFKHPWRVFYVVGYVYYALLLLIYRIRKL